MKAQPEVLRIDDRDVTITNPGKLFFAEAGVTKLDLVQYYLAVAPWPSSDS
jgi:DNA primase